MPRLPLLLTALALVALCRGVSSLGAVTDDFDDGDDAGWTRYAPLAPFGAGSTVTFPGGWYRIQGPPSPAPSLLGPQRAGGIRTDQPYGRVRVAADITAWSVEVHQSVGLFARVKDAGLATTKGYTFNYNSQSGYFQITRVNNEAPDRTVDESSWRLDPAATYRLVFTAVGDLLMGQAYASANPTVPVHSVFGQDAVFDSGSAGVFAFSLNADTGIDARFDNYEVGPPPETVRATLLTVSPRPGELPAAPISLVSAKLVDLETSVNSDSIRLEVDGAVVGPLERLAPDLLTLITWTPSTPLAADRSHTAKLTFSDEKGSQEFVWTFGPTSTGTGTVLVGAGRPDGPYEPESEAVHDATAHKFTVRLVPEARFYRVRDSVLRTVKSIAATGGNAVIEYR